MIFMASIYKNSLKKYLCELICIHGNSTIKTAEAYSVPLKTLEKWITSYNKNNHCFDSIDEPNDFHLIENIDSINYDDLSNDDLKKIIMKKDIEIQRLKKGYTVKEGGMENKVFVSFSKKNMK